jgi:hypothetical protein
MRKALLAAEGGFVSLGPCLDLPCDEQGDISLSRSLIGQARAFRGHGY